MADDYNDWKDGRPSVGPTGDGTFDDWVDGRPVTRLGVTLEVADAAHVTTSDNLDTVHSVAGWSTTHNTSTSTIRSYRQSLSFTDLPDPGVIANQIRLRFQAPNTNGYRVTGCSVGLYDDSLAYQTGEYVRVTFNGGDEGVDIDNGGGAIYSDWIDLPFVYDATSYLMFHFDTDNTTAYPSTYNLPATSTSRAIYRKDGVYDHEMTEDLAGQSYTNANYLYGVNAIDWGITNITLTNLDAYHVTTSDNLTITTAAPNVTLENLDSYHDHVADAAQPSKTVSVYSVTISSGTNTQYSVRNLVAAADLDDPGSGTVQTVRAKFKSAIGGELTITGASIGLRSGSTEDYQTDKFVRLTFDGGNNSTTFGSVPAAESKWSDWVTYSDFDEATDHFVHIDLNGSDYRIGFESLKEAYRKAGGYDEAMTADISGYSFVGYSYALEEIQVQVINWADAITLENLDAYHVTTSDNIDLTLIYILTVAEADSLHDADNLDLVQLIDLTVAEAYHDIVDEGPITIQTGLTLVVAESYHDVVDEGPVALTQAHSLTVAECDHLHDADNINVGTLYVLTVAECYHVNAPPNLALIVPLLVAESYHDLVSPNINLGTDVTLDNLDSYHLHAAGAAVLSHGGNVLTIYTASGTLSYDTANGGTHRSPLPVQGVFPQHNEVRVKIRGPSYIPNYFYAGVTKVSIGPRSGSTDDCTEAPTPITFNGGDRHCDLTVDEEVWSDWVSFDWPTSGDVHLSMYVDGDGSVSYAVWDDDRTRYYYGSSAFDYCDDQTVSLFTGSDTRTFAALQARAAAPIDLVVEDGAHVTTSDVIDLGQHFLTTADADHLHDADSIELSVTAWTVPDSWTYDTSVAAKNYRMILPAASLSYDGAYVRVKIECHDTDSVDMDGMSIGQRAAAGDLYDYGDTPVRFTFDGGNNAVTVAAGQTKWSDWVPFTLDSTKDHLVHCHLDGPHKFSYITSMDAYSKNAATDETMIADVSGYSLVNQFFYLVKLEVRVRTALEFADAAHLHTADNLDLVEVIDLVPAEADHVVTSDNIELNQHFLSTDESAHVTDADAIALTQDHMLAVDAGDHLHTAENISMGGVQNLIVAESAHLHTADAIPLILHLDLADNYHVLASPVLTLVSGFDLVNLDSYHLHTAEAITGLNTTFGSVDEAYHVVESDEIDLTGTQYLVIDDDTLLHFADLVAAYMVGDLPVQPSYIEHAADNLELGGLVNLVVREAYHRHFADGLLAFTQDHYLDMDEAHSYHVLTSDNVVIPALDSELENLNMRSLTALRAFIPRTARRTIVGRAA